MASIQTGIELQDNFTNVLYGIIGSVNTAVSAMEEMQQTMNADVDTSGIEVARESIDQTTAALEELNAAMENQTAPDIAQAAVPDNGSGQVISVGVNPVLPDPLVENPDPVPLPVQPNAPPDTVEIPVDLTESDQQIEQMRQQLQGIEQMQQAIREVGRNAYVLPDGVPERISEISGEIQQLQAGIDYLQENPFNLDSSFAQLQIESLQNAIDETVSSQSELNNILGNIPEQVINTEVNIDTPEPVEVTVRWQSDSLEVFTTTGYERFQDEIASADEMLAALNRTQAQIEQTASTVDLLPNAAVQDINSLGQRLQEVHQRLQEISNDPVNAVSEDSNARLEQLRGQLDGLIQQQNELNAAMESGDISGINAAYLQLSQNLNNTERFIRDNTDEQGRFTQSIQESTGEANKLLNTIKGAVAAYVSIQSIGKVLDISDEIVQTTARLDLIVDDGGSIEELQNKIFASAQNARGSYMVTADAISKLGMQASQAFSSNDELIAFIELLNKQFVNAGTSVQGVESVMLQLTQSMAAGKLQGEELNAVLDNAAPIVQNIQKYLEEVQGIDAGNIKELASEGEITAEIVKNAMFYASDEINAKFEAMPMTFGQVWQSFQNTALIAFKPVLDKINEIANSEGFQAFVNTAIEWLAALANVVLEVFDFMGGCVSFVADNWSVISPIIWGIVAALAVYGAYLAITKGIELATAAVKGALAVAEFIHCAAVAASTGATIAATAAQMGLNGAMYACPIVWIIILIIGLIALLVMLCNWIADITGAANSGIGIIVGALAVAAAFIGNLFVALINMAIDIFVVLWNFIASFVNFFGNVFTDPVGAIARLFFDLVDCILGLLQTLAGAIDAIFGSNLAGAVQGWRDDLGGWVDDTFGQGEEIMAKINGEDWHVDRFEYGEAWDAGVEIGDGIAESIDNFSIDDLFGGTDIPNPDDYTSQFEGLGNSLGDISGDTGSISDAMDVTEEDLKYLRDVAEQEAVNRFTTAEIKVEMTNNNNISNGMDLDGVVSGLSSGVNEAIETMAEGVHD